MLLHIERTLGSGTHLRWLMALLLFGVLLPLAHVDAKDRFGQDKHEAKLAIIGVQSIGDLLVGEPIELQLESTGEVKDIRWILPEEGMHASKTMGRTITIECEWAGEWSFLVEIEDASGQVVEESFSINITEDPCAPKVWATRYQFSVEYSELLQRQGFSGGSTRSELHSDVPADHCAADAIRLLQSYGLASGFPDGTYKGEYGFTRFEYAMLLAHYITYIDAEIPLPEGEDWAIPVDVEAGHWALEAIEFITRLGVFHADADGNYRGGQALTAAEITESLERLDTIITASRKQS